MRNRIAPALRLTLAAATLLAAAPALAETWQCKYVGSWLTTATGNNDAFAWDIVWTKTGGGWALTGSFQDKYGQSYFDGRCANKHCDFHQKYTSGKLSGKTYFYQGDYVNKSMNASRSITAFKGQWGYDTGAANGGTWNAVATCDKD